MITKNKDWQDEVALQRYTMITPLLSEDLDNAKRIAMREKIAQDNLDRSTDTKRHTVKTGFRGFDRRIARSGALRRCRKTSMNF